MALVDMREQLTFLLELSGNAHGASPVVRRAEFAVVIHAIANVPPVHHLLTHCRFQSRRPPTRLSALSAGPGALLVDSLASRAHRLAPLPFIRRRQIAAPLCNRFAATHAVAIAADAASRVGDAEDPRAGVVLDVSELLRRD
eukprot:6463528-Pyramimonas_sp.AAC.1